MFIFNTRFISRTKPIKKLVINLLETFPHTIRPILLMNLLNTHALGPTAPEGPHPLCVERCVWCQLSNIHKLSWPASIAML